MTENIERISSEASDEYSDDDLFSISSWGADLSFRELIQRYEDDELLKPELQRKYVWDKVEASRFIDSILLGLPVPSIFLAKANEETLLIIDGYQRIMTVYDFVRGIFSKDDKVFKLSRTERVNSRWRGKAFAELQEVEKRRIRNTTIHAIIFSQDHPEDNNTSLFQIFERINTSGKTLMPQEIRNCVYQGAFNDLLFELNENENWRVLFGKKRLDERMRDMEFILRYLALSSEEFSAIEKEGISLKRFLNKFMGIYQHAEDKVIQEFRERFTNLVDFLFTNIGKRVFHNLSKTDPERLAIKFSPTVFDSVAIATDKVLEEGEAIEAGHLEKRRLRLLKDEQYQKAISTETMRKRSIETRISLASNYLFRKS